jgi:hypothetical protein
MPVDTPRSDYNDFRPKWDRLRDCFNGKDALIKAGNRYCPDLPGLDYNENKAYRSRGTFYNAVMRTVGGLNGAIFQDEPDVQMPETLKPMLDDVTLADVPFETFAADVGRELFLTGRVGVLVDMPVDATNGQPTLPGMSAASPDDMRPYFVSYRAEDIINWRTERRGGDEVLTMIVLREDVETAKEGDDFTVCIESQYRVLKLDDSGNCIVQIWTKGDSGKYEQSTTGDVGLMRRGDSLTFVPFIFFGPIACGPDIVNPPLIDLADVNLGHWRNSVDHEHGLHLVALPTPWVAGAKGDSGTGTMKMGPSVVWELDAQGRAGMLEFTGTGLAAIVTAMDEKKKLMASLGARLLEDAPGHPETASAVRLRHTAETASLKTIAQSMEMGLTQVLRISVWWQGTDATPEDTEANVELNKEYLDVRASPQEVQVMLTALQAGEISFETWYAFLTSGGWSREGIDAAQEQKDIASRQIDTTEPLADLAEE